MSRRRASGCRGLARANGTPSLGLSRSCDGRSAFNPSIEGRLLVATVRSTVRHRTQSQLSERELSVLHHMARGLTDHEIGGAVGISEFTVKTHVRRLYRKLAVRIRVQAVSRAASLGLIELR